MKLPELSFVVEETDTHLTTIEVFECDDDDCGESASITLMSRNRATGNGIGHDLARFDRRGGRFDNDYLDKCKAMFAELKHAVMFTECFPTTPVEMKGILQAAKGY